MRRPTTLVIIILTLTLAAALFWRLGPGRGAGSFIVADASLTGWRLVASDGTDPWVIAVKPPDALSAALFQELLRRTGKPLIAPATPALPLVLRSEFDEGLQGVYGTDSVLRMATDAGVETARFQPLCMAHRTEERPSGRAEVYFVPFEAPAFSQFRIDIVPAEPEHAGIGVYEPSTLAPILIVADTTGAFDHWQPLRFNGATDCMATLEIATALP